MHEKFSTDKEGYNLSPGDSSMDKSEKDTFLLNNKLGYHFQSSDDLQLRVGYRGLRQENEKFDADNNEYLFKYKMKRSDGFDIDLQYNVNRMENHAVVVGLNYSNLTASREISNPSGMYIYDETDTLYAFYIQDQFHLFDDHIQLTLGARYDKWDDFDGVLTPRAAVNISFPGKEEITLRLAATTSFRRPSFDESYI
jgi:outer membrane receptor protein involved in Fe transport